MNRYTLDARRLMCPMPVIRTQDKIKTLMAGDQLTVICSDPGALNDLPAWCRINGHTVVNTVQSAHEVSVTIKVTNGV